jgi:hypothetical protein
MLLIKLKGVLISVLPYHTTPLLLRCTKPERVVVFGRLSTRFVPVLNAGLLTVLIGFTGVEEAVFA